MKVTPLKQRIIELGMTNREVSRLTGIDEPTLSLIVTGKRQKISVDKAIRIARALDTSVEELFGWTVEKDDTE